MFSAKKPTSKLLVIITSKHDPHQQASLPDVQVHETPERYRTDASVQRLIVWLRRDDNAWKMKFISTDTKNLPIEGRQDTTPTELLVHNKLAYLTFLPRCRDVKAVFLKRKWPILAEK